MPAHSCANRLPELEQRPKLAAASGSDHSGWASIEVPKQVVALHVCCFHTFPGQQIDIDFNVESSNLADFRRKI
jgi:hypothetical protein